MTHICRGICPWKAVTRYIWWQAFWLPPQWAIVFYDINQLWIVFVFGCVRLWTAFWCCELVIAIPSQSAIGFYDRNQLWIVFVFGCVRLWTAFLSCCELVIAIPSQSAIGFYNRNVDCFFVFGELLLGCILMLWYRSWVMVMIMWLRLSGNLSSCVLLL